MWSTTTMIIMPAPQWCKLRMSSPPVNSVTMYFTLLYASPGAGA
jgi:hypothetical protein